MLAGCFTEWRCGLQVLPLNTSTGRAARAIFQRSLQWHSSQGSSGRDRNGSGRNG